MSTVSDYGTGHYNNRYWGRGRGIEVTTCHVAPDHWLANVIGFLPILNIFWWIFVKD